MYPPRGMSSTTRTSTDGKVGKCMWLAPRQRRIAIALNDNGRAMADNGSCRYWESSRTELLPAVATLTAPSDVGTAAGTTAEVLGSAGVSNDGLSADGSELGSDGVRAAVGVTVV
jgi:hypothetical protein